MLLFLNKKQDETDSPTSAVEDTSGLRDFIPYHSHYNPSTIITKNGELMQTIKIASNKLGLNYESGHAANSAVRDVIRQALSESITTDKFAIWVHSIRKRKPLRYASKFDEPFASYVNDRWQKKHRWVYQYYNEVYITIVREGQDAPILNKNDLRYVLLPKVNVGYRRAYLEDAAIDLDQTVGRVVARLQQHYEAHVLSAVERPSDLPGMEGQTIFYSEPMEFFGNLLNLRQETFPMTETDISDALCASTVTFGFNAVGARQQGGGRRFGAMMSLKQYQEVSPETADRVMQSPIELIISEAFHFVPNDQAVEKMQMQKDVFLVSDDAYSMKATGLEDLFLSNRNSPVDYGQHQVSIMVLVDEFKHLTDEVARIQEAFAELGLIAMREDIRLEECFWTQMPGNFEFMRRMEPLSTDKIAGFARLNYFPNGNSGGNHWGEAVALIPTRVNSPYFLNFHAGDNGHTLFFDFNSFHDSAGNVLLNFLLTSSLKFHNRIFIFDRHQSARLWCDKVAGDYHPFSGAGRQKHGVNPFALEDTPRNRSFLAAWTLSLAGVKPAETDALKPLLATAIEAMYAMPPEQRNLETFVAQLSAAPMLVAGLAPFHGAGKGAGRFDTAAETLDFSKPVQCFDMDPVVDAPNSSVPLFSYLLHRVILSLDGTPTIIVLHDAWKLLENDFFAPRLESLLEMLAQNNTMVIFTTASPQNEIGTSTLATLAKACATRIYVPDDISISYKIEALGLQPKDAKFLRKMERQQGDFLLHQNGESIALRAGMGNMDDIRAILSNDIKNLIAAGGRFATLPQDR